MIKKIIRIQEIKISHFGTFEFFPIFWIKTSIYLSLGLLKRRPSYRRSLQSSKENIQLSKHEISLFFYIFVGNFALMDPDSDPATQINADPDSKP
jgi:hypothetical protein